MTARFSIIQLSSPEDSYFDRQQRIAWWQQSVIEQAKVMVVGAGAIGNETLKNLALLGFRNIFIVDFDIISPSNLSRTVLFRKADIEKKKAEVSALKTQELSLAEDPRVDWFHGDLVWELGTGVYRHMDIILGCLDNVETRFALNRQCRLVRKPWIDSGITELRARVNVYGASGVCYQCQASPEQYKAARVRYSCDSFKRRYVQEGKVPTVQIASSLVAALQVQEAVKWLCGDEQIRSDLEGKMIFFEGRRNDFDWFPQIENPECMAHAEYPDIIQLDTVGAGIRLEDFLELVSTDVYSGEGATLDFATDRSFIKTANCRFCDTPIEFYQAEHRIYDTDLVCEKCREDEKNRTLQPIEKEQVGKNQVSEFSLARTEKRILGMTLYDLGVPYWHIVAVRSLDGTYRYYELSGDKPLVLPSFFNKIEIKSHG